MIDSRAPGHILAATLGAAGTFLTLVACSRAPAANLQGAPPPIQVEEITTSLDDLSVRIPAVGSLQSPQTTTVAADVSGIVVALDAPEGESVASTHLLARLDDAEARAALTVARARHRNAERQLERIRKLVEEGFAPERALDDAIAEMDTASGLLEEATTALEKTYVRAPFSGVLGLRTAQLGQYVSAGDPIVELTRIDPLELVFGVPERYAGQLRVGQSVEARTGSCGSRFEAEVSAIDPTVDRATRSLLVQAAVANPEGQLRPGMSASVTIEVGALSGVVTIPHEAVVRQSSAYRVWVLDEANRATPRPVELGAFSVDRVQVREGLAAGERVVTAGHQKLRPDAATLPSPHRPIENPLLRLGEIGAGCEDG